MRKKSIAAIAALTLSIAAFSAPARTVDQWEAQVRVKLAAAAVLVSLFDGHLTFDPYIGTLHDGNYTDLSVQLRQGVTYALIGVCDDYCKDLDMKVYDDDGYLVRQDTSPDATPGVFITPRRSQNFRVRIVMERCNSEPCFYGLGVFN